jgi:hypothetical protein
MSTPDPASLTHGDDGSMAARLIARKLTRKIHRLASLMPCEVLYTATVEIVLRQTGYDGSTNILAEEHPSHDFFTASEPAPEGSMRILQGKTMNV